MRKIGSACTSSKTCSVCALWSEDVWKLVCQADLQSAKHRLDRAELRLSKGEKSRATKASFPGVTLPLSTGASPVSVARFPAGTRPPTGRPNQGAGGKVTGGSRPLRKGQVPRESATSVRTGVVDSGDGRLTITRAVKGYVSNVGNVSSAPSISRETSELRLALETGPRRHPLGFPPHLSTRCRSLTEVQSGFIPET